MSWRKDFNKEVACIASFVPLLRTSTITGTGVDLQNFQATCIVIAAGAITDGTHTPTIEESDSSGSGFSAVAAADLSGTLVAITANSVQEVGYLGSKRYIRVVSTVTGSPSTGGTYGALVIRAGARNRPQ